MESTGNLEALPPIELPPRQEKNFAAIADAGVDGLARLSAHFSSITPPPMRMKDLRKEAEQALGPELGKDVVDGMATLALWRRRQGVTSSVIVDAVTQGLASSKLTEEQRRRWVELTAQLVQILSTPPMYLSAKATDLSLDYDN